MNKIVSSLHEQSLEVLLTELMKSFSFPNNFFKNSMTFVLRVTAFKLLNASYLSTTPVVFS